MSRALARRYAASLAGLVTLLPWLLLGQRGVPAGLLLCVVAVLAVTLLAGLGPGLLTALLGASVDLFFLVPSIHSVGIVRLLTGLQLLVLLAVALGTSWLATSWSEARRQRRTAEDQLRQQLDYTAAITHSMGEGVCALDGEGRVSFSNPAAEGILGWTASQLQGQRFHDLVHGRDESQIPCPLARALRDGETGRAEDATFLRADGALAPVSYVATPIITNGSATGTVIAFRDITERRQLERERAEKRARADVGAALRSVIQASPLPIASLDPAGNVQIWNRAAEQLFGWSEADVLGRPLPGVPEENQSEWQALVERVRRGEQIFQVDVVRARKDGSTVDLQLALAPVFDHDGRVSAMVTSAVDISDRKRTEQELEYQALHDSLTDLPNRTLLRDRLRQGILEARRRNSTIALLFMDLDRFKEVNDAFGHHCGDLLLQQVGQRLRGLLRESDTVARLGGDEFAILLPAADKLGAVLVSRKLLEALESPFVLDRHHFDVGASIGVAVCPEHGEDAPTLMQRADTAMYIAKRARTGYAVYAQDQDQNSPSRVLLTSDLRRAIEEGEGLFLHYQPKVDLRTSEVEGMEALVRWRHPDHGFIPPDKLIPLAEQTGLIKSLSLWVVRSALRQCHAWKRAGVPTRVAVNLSALNLHDRYLAGTVERLLRDYEVEPNSLEVELTESAIMGEPQRALETLTRLHDLGIRISIDDFGTGYSSLTYLKRLPVDQIKIDKSFVMDMTVNENDAFIARSVIDLGHNLGLRVVAEGVENRETWDLLASMGCDLAQGFYLSRPLPVKEITSWLRNPRPGPSTMSG